MQRVEAYGTLSDMRDEQIVVRMTRQERAQLREYMAAARERTGMPASESATILNLMLVGLKEKTRKK